MRVDLADKVCNTWGAAKLRRSRPREPQIKAASCAFSGLRTHFLHRFKDTGEKSRGPVSLEQFGRFLNAELPRARTSHKLYTLDETSLQNLPQRGCNRRYAVREMAYRLWQQFTYLECAKCGCLQIAGIPSDMTRYPSDYYAFQEHGWLKTLVRRQWSAYAYSETSVLGRIVSNVFVPNNALQALRCSAGSHTATVLAVGSGSGRLLLDLAWLGFANLTARMRSLRGSAGLPSLQRWQNGICDGISR